MNKRYQETFASHREAVLFGRTIRGPGVGVCVEGCTVYWIYC